MKTYHIDWDALEGCIKVVFDKSKNSDGLKKEFEGMDGMRKVISQFEGCDAIFYLYLSERVESANDAKRRIEEICKEYAGNG